MENLSSLTKKEKRAVIELKDILFTRLKNRLVLIKAFGSKIRRDFHKGSDIDILVVYKGNGKKNVESKILDIQWDLIKKYQYDVYLSIITYSLNEYKKDTYLQTPFIYHINKEGVDLWNTSQKKKS